MKMKKWGMNPLSLIPELLHHLLSQRMSHKKNRQKPTQLPRRKNWVAKRTKNLGSHTMITNSLITQKKCQLLIVILSRAMLLLFINGEYLLSWHQYLWQSFSGYLLGLTSVCMTEQSLCLRKNTILAVSRESLTNTSPKALSKSMTRCPMSLKMMTMPLIPISILGARAIVPTFQAATSVMAPWMILIQRPPHPLNLLPLRYPVPVQCYHALLHPQIIRKKTPLPLPKHRRQLPALYRPQQVQVARVLYRSQKEDGTQSGLATIVDALTMGNIPAIGMTTYRIHCFLAASNTLRMNPRSVWKLPSLPSSVMELVSAKTHRTFCRTLLSPFAFSQSIQK
mmetsp:Transcript_15950/g.33737  ORF Transcript_15950/g.33737 Transcript_15950/m.33737 type:complete len:338 (-) Transcript_15950:2392-3405(-)